MLDEPPAVAVVVDGEARTVADRASSVSRRRHPHAGGVEGRDPHRLGALDPTSSTTRRRISSAALFVKVIARMRAGGTPEATRRAMRRVSTLVFPEPAPAMTTSGPPSYRTASRWGGFRSATRSSMAAASSRHGGRVRRECSVGIASSGGSPPSGVRSCEKVPLLGSPRVRARGGTDDLAPEATGALEPSVGPARLRRPGGRRRRAHSHSIVPGGLEVMS